MSNKNALILIEAMVPFTNYWGGCQRAFMFGQQLLKSGYCVHVICRNQSNNEEGIVEHEGLIVSGRGNPIKIATDQRGTSKPSIIYKLKNIVKNNSKLKDIVTFTFRYIYSEPNIFDGPMSLKWVKSNKEYIQQYIKDNDIGLVIISGPPFGLFHIAPDLQKFTEVVLDYRDPWTLWYEKSCVAEIAERRALKCASLIVTSTEALANSIKDHFGIDKVYPILNGYNKKMWEGIKKNNARNKQFVVSHIGLITLNREGGFRNASNFIKAAELFLNTHEDALVQFVGVKNPDEGYQMGLNNRMTFIPQVPVERSLEMIQESDVLVVLHTANDASGKYIICGKIYDYLMSGNEILSIGDFAYANRDIVENNNAGMHCKNDMEDIIDALNSLYSKWKERATTRHVNLEMYSRDYQNKRFLQLIQDITK